MISHDIRFGDDTARKVILSQVRLLDVKRLQNKILTIDEGEFQSIKKAVIRLIE